MTDIYSDLHRLLAAGKRCVLARIVRQAGSAPRAAGTRFLILADGTHLGTIGGGMLEHEVLRKAREVFSGGRPAVIEVRMSGQEVAAGEMLCGGNVDVLLEPVFPEDDQARSVFQEIARMTAQGRRGALVTVLADDGSELKRAIVTAEGGRGSAGGLCRTAGARSGTAAVRGRAYFEGGGAARPHGRLPRLRHRRPRGVRQPRTLSDGRPAAGVPGGRGL
jgi:xanthine/CO dehydrogenase XdhC/CoxF family maturation factor